MQWNTNTDWELCGELTDWTVITATTDRNVIEFRVYYKRNFKIDRAVRFSLATVTHKHIQINQHQSESASVFVFAFILWDMCTVHVVAAKFRKALDFACSIVAECSICVRVHCDQYTNKSLPVHSAHIQIRNDSRLHRLLL